MKMVLEVWVCCTYDNIQPSYIMGYVFIIVIQEQVIMSKIAQLYCVIVIMV